MSRSNRHRKQKNWLEWAFFAVGLALIVPLLSYLAYDGWNRPAHHPVLQARLGKAVRQGEHYGVPVKVTNTGGSTAEGVIVEVTLVPADGEAETADFEIDFIASQAERDGWVTFRSHPATARRLDARIRGFREP